MERLVGLRPICRHALWMWLLLGKVVWSADMLQWSELPPLPDRLGVAGPLVGVHENALIVAGGANFARPVWENDKQWHDRIHVLTNGADGPQWHDAGKLPHKVAYAATVSTAHGVLCMGGNDANSTFDQVWLLRWENNQIRVVDYPRLPRPCVYGDAATIGDTVYLAGGQSDQTDNSVMNNFWKLELAPNGQPLNGWKELAPWAGPPRAHNIVVAQENGYDECVYVISGRRRNGDTFEFLKDVWEYTPRTNTWRGRAEVPACVMAGTGIRSGQSHLFILGGDDGALFGQADALKDDHPGFAKQTYAFHTITNTWVAAGSSPGNHVTTKAVRWNDQFVIPSGEVRPRVRTPTLLTATPISTRPPFGLINYAVLLGYLAGMVGIGLYFARKNTSTDDFFRGGKQMPWWAVGCSIYATMLSSLTFTGIPSKAFQQDWVLAVGNFMIPVVAFVAVYVALPFYRGIDATSAYEYLERRFNRGVRLFGSASFTLFHLFRMAVVMSLTGLALAVATPLTATQSVLLMGVLCVVYCTMGGIEAVIWTDTIQTFVLLGGALIAAALLISGVDGGLAGFLASASNDGKFNWANHNWDITSSQIAIWIIVIGGIAQNLSSYTADQAVVQRYMTTPTQQLAARSIWTNAILSIPTTLLFFAVGSALYCYYQSNPAKLDPTIVSDQVFPLFIAKEMPVGLAGLIVAGIFAAAQSTVSTSMNSSATTIVTDFLRPIHACKSEQAYLKVARGLTFLFGVAGTLLGLLFIDPDIKSLFDAFIKVIGIFMGVLGGLFVLGAMTRKANGAGALIGAFIGAAVMFYLWRFTRVTFYLYTLSGIVTCFVVGYVASLVMPSEQRELDGLTVYTMNRASREV